MSITPNRPKQISVYEMYKNSVKKRSIASQNSIDFSSDLTTEIYSYIVSRTSRAPTDGSCIVGMFYTLISNSKFGNMSSYCNPPRSETVKPDRKPRIYKTATRVCHQPLFA